ncbi:MAG: hypothetical protein AAFY76_18685, partial [Cyanobacteria bacterium J06649_11]
KIRINRIPYDDIEYELNTQIPREIFSWNNDEEMGLVGRWEADMGTNGSNEQQQILVLELSQDRAGVEKIMMRVSESSEVVEFMSQNIVGWEMEGTKIKLHYYNSAQRKLWHKYVIINRRTEKTITGYISDPELEEKFSKSTEPETVQ